MSYQWGWGTVTWEKSSRRSRPNCHLFWNKGQMTFLWVPNPDSTMSVRADSNRRVQHSHFGDKELTLFLRVSWLCNCFVCVCYNMDPHVHVSNRYRSSIYFKRLAHSHYILWSTSPPTWRHCLRQEKKQPSSFFFLFSPPTSQEKKDFFNTVGI